VEGDGVILYLQEDLMRLKPVELEIELFCRGARIDSTAEESGARRITRTRAGLGSGLEIVIPAKRKDIWANVPVIERFAETSPFRITSHGADFVIEDERYGEVYPITIPEEPAWYSRSTIAGTEMSRVGVLQGNYLGIYISNRCMYWALSPPQACKFCTTGRNLGEAEESIKKVSDVVEVALAAREESGAVFTHLNTGYHFEDLDGSRPIYGLTQARPFVEALRKSVGGFIGVQAVPVRSNHFYQYDELIDCGVDHFSFCYEFEDPEVFADLCPGKAATMGQKAFFDAMEYTSKKLGPGRVSGEIIAGLEPISATKRGIDRIVNAGAFPTVCIFRPTIGSELEHLKPPDPEEMKEVFAYLWDACRRAGLPVGILPIEVSLVVQPEEGAELVESSFGSMLYQWKLGILRQVVKPYIAWKMRPGSN
jgi:solute carrier family 13 (sodium-dependent dicarboxylate transporter), member 2/3/5